MTYKTIIVLFFSLALFACKEKEALPMNGAIDIAPTFQPYVDQFIKEASIRGKEIDFSDTGLSIQFSELPLGTAAQCQELGDGSRGNHRILIDENLWAIAAPTRREFLVFHELGHCELDRRHQNDQLPNGEWQSMMQGTISNSPLSDKERGRPVNFHGFRRDYYLNELFDLIPNIPDWSNFQDSYTDISPNQKTIQFDTSNIKLIQERFELATIQYELTIHLKRLKDAGTIGIKYGTLQQSYLFKVTGEGEILIELAGQVPNEIDFYNGGAIILSSPYRLYFCNDLLLPNSTLELTIRQQNGITSFFLNQEFLYQVDAFDDPAILVGSIQENDNLDIERFSLSTL